MQRLTKADILNLEQDQLGTLSATSQIQIHYRQTILWSAQTPFYLEKIMFWRVRRRNFPNLIPPFLI